MNQVFSYELIVKICVFTLVFLYVMAANALDLADAFGSLVSTVNPGTYHSQVRGYLTGGSFNAHFPSDSVQLISLTTPNYSAGCSGISMYLGGFSYISSQQFTAMLKTISTNSLGYSFQLALRTLCPICSTVVSDLQRAVQAANKLALDQCQLAEGLIQTGIQSNSNLNQWINSQSAQTAVNSGETADYLSGINSVTGDVTLAFNKLVNAIDLIRDRGNQQQAVQNSHLGSSTWNLLSGLTEAQKTFIQSLIGSNLVTTIKAENDINQKPIIMHLPATLTPETLAKVFLYGARARENASVYLWQCRPSSLASIKNDGTSQLDYCMNANKVPLIQSKWYKNSRAINNVSLADVGFFGMTYAILFQALNNIINNHSLGTPENVILPNDIYSNPTSVSLAIQPSFTETQITGFISLAPLPLYRAINLGAIYPEVAQALVNNVATLVASNYTIAYIKQLLDIKHADNTVGGTVGLSPRDFSQLETALSNVNSNLNEQLVAMLNHLQANEAWSAHINQVQSMVYSQVIASGLSDNFAYSTALMGGNL